MHKFKGISQYFKNNAPQEVVTPFLIVGLGNPGRQYRNNRHNVGFLLLDQLAERLDTNFSRMQSKALVGKANYQNKPLILAKPQTYMNLSGQAVGGILKFYKIPNVQLLVIYDEVDLPLGTLRLRTSGGSAGHKGMNSIIERLGSHDFPRLRIGIGRPPGRMDAANYVLQDFANEEIQSLQFALARAVDSVLTFISDGLETAMNRFNSPE